jgi:hypothetical protein
MIVQQVNLYQERFKTTRVWLSATDMLLLIALLLLILAGSSYWYQQQLITQKRQLDILLQQQQQSSAELLAVRKQLEKGLADNRLEQQIFKISDAISARKRLIQFVEDNRFGDGEGFSGYLSSLSEINAQDVWLNEISLSQKDLRLSGSALKAASIPQFFSLIKQRQLFSGHRFEVFEVNRSKARDWKIDFLIASRVDENE